MNSNEKKTSDKAVNKQFIKMADEFIEQANKQCTDNDHQLVNASLLYASARFSAFITAALAESKEGYEKGVNKAIDFYLKEFEKMLKEHMSQYTSTFDK